MMIQENITIITRINERIGIKSRAQISQKRVAGLMRHDHSWAWFRWYDASIRHKRQHRKCELYLYCWNNKKLLAAFNTWWDAYVLENGDLSLPKDGASREMLLENVNGAAERAAAVSVPAPVKNRRPATQSA